MENPETLTPLGTQDTGPQKHSIQHIIRFIWIWNKANIDKKVSWGKVSQS